MAYLMSEAERALWERLRAMVKADGPDAKQARYYRNLIAKGQATDSEIQAAIALVRLVRRE